jgi:hypothetical protein
MNIKFKIKRPKTWKEEEIVIDLEEVKDLLKEEDPDGLSSSLIKELEKTIIHCEIRERALYETRQLVEPGSDISKIAGQALCYGNYTRKDIIEED